VDAQVAQGVAELGELLHQALGEVGTGDGWSAELTLLGALETVDQLERLIEPIELPALELDGLLPLEPDDPVPWSVADLALAPAPAPAPAPVLEPPRLATVRDWLLLGVPLDLPDRHLAAAACGLILERHDRREAAVLRRVGLRCRDELIRSAAATFYAGSARAKATALLRDAQRYAASAWRHDRGCVGCPDRIRGTVQELLWGAFKAHPDFPSSLRQVQNILAAGDL
jgi:hypothetical protein